MDHTTSTTTPSIIGLKSADNADVINTDFYVNGIQITTELSSVNTKLNSSGNGSILGGFSSSTDMSPTSTYDYNGYIYELVVFTEELNTTCQRLLENYLSSKYGVTTANDYYSYDTNHKQDMGGIGRTTSSDRHLSGYSDILGLSVSPGSLNDGEYFMMGHNGGSVSFSTSEPPNGKSTAQKIGREWRLDMTGSSSKSLKVKADLTGFSLPTGFNDYGIFVDSDGDFTNGAAFYPRMA